MINRYWSGDRVDHHGTYFEVHDVELLPATVQQPRPPVWIGGYWPTRAPMRRAARWDGAVPLFHSARHGVAPDPAEVGELVTFISAERSGDLAGFEIVVGGTTPGDPIAAGTIVDPLAAAGATWWDERMPQTRGDFQRFEPVLRRVRQGPPRR